MNLLKETIDVILVCGHSPEQIIFIGSECSGHSCTWNEFKLLADHDYDNGFGITEVATDLVIVFSDRSKMFREEYNGSEFWKYSPLFRMPIDQKRISSLFIKGYFDLDEQE